VTDIKEIVNNFEGKNTHFLLKLEGENIHMKCDDTKEKDKWIGCLNGLREIYKGKKLIDWDEERKSHKVEIDLRLVNLIIDEQESICESTGDFMTEIIKKRQSYEAALKAKKLKTAFDMISPKIFQSHVQFGMVKMIGG
jgi:hypothetical protein